MARTIPLPSGTGNGNGSPWGPRSSDTGTPLSGVAQASTLTITGTPQPDVAKVEYSTLVCAPGPLGGDVATLTGSSAWTATSVAAVADVWDAPVGTATGGDTCDLTIGATTYSAPAVNGDDASTAAAVALAAAADADYLVTAVGTSVHCVQKFPGTAPKVISAGVTGAGGTTFGPAVNTTPGVPQSTQQEMVDLLIAAAAGDTLWTFTDGGAGVIHGAHQVAGVTADAVTSGYVPNDGAGTFVTAVHQPGIAANTARVQDNLGHLYPYTVQGGDTNDDIATGLAAAINGNDGYSASALGHVVSVQNAVGVAFSFTDASVNVTTPGTVITYALVAAGSTIVAAGSPFLLQASRVQFGGLWCDLLAGTGCTVVPWFWSGPANVFAAQAPIVITANKFIPLDLSAVDGLFIEQKTFVGGGVVKVTATGAPLGPGGM